MINFSQSTEQDVITDFFKNYKGVFCDCGSNDGITLSNTYALTLLGWDGILAEPSQEAFKRLQFNYASNMNVCLFNCAVTSNYEGMIKMYESGEHLGKGDTSLLSTIHEKELDRWKGSPNTFKETMVKAFPINKIILDSGYKQIDFFSIDIEGGELELLPSIDFKNLQTKMICVEYNGKEQEKYDDIIIPQGYSLIHKNAENLIYVS